MHFKFLSEFIYRHPANSFAEFKLNNETLYLASTTLFEESLKKEITEKTKFSLKKYQQRSSTRYTPFGLFAGCGVGKWENESIIETQLYSRHTRLDMNVVCEIAQNLVLNPIIKKHLTYFTNNSLYKVSDKYRYVEYILQNKIRNYQITSVDISPHINDVLALASKGANYSTLMDCLFSYNVNAEEADFFLDELVQSQIITTNLYPNVTGIEFYTILLNNIKEIAVKTQEPTIVSIFELLFSINEDIKKIDRNFINEVLRYKIIYNKLKQLLPHLTEENLFQTDLYYNHTTSILDNTIQKSLIETISFLNKLHDEEESNNIKKFRERFQNYYEDQEIPLLQVLDTVSGIGYLYKDSAGINPIIDDIYYSDNSGKTLNIKWNSTSSLLLNKLLYARIHNLQSVEFRDEDIKDIDEKKYSFPPSISAFFSIVSNSKNIIYFKHSSGSSASRFLGRFAHGNPTIHSIINKITEHEIQFHDDKIIAEIVHLPENRTGNILLRPHTHKVGSPGTELEFAL